MKIPQTPQVFLAARAGANATVLQAVLEERARVCRHEPTVEAVSEAIQAEAALIVLTEEVLADSIRAQQLGDRLGQQPNWSNIPVIILLKECQRFGDCLTLLGQTTHSRSVVLLELPLKRLIFGSLVDACLQNRQRQYELRDTLIQLKESNQILESFSHTAAHELRNPLGVLTSGLDLLARTPLAAKQTKLVEMGQRTAKSMNRTLGALLDYGKMQSRPDSFTPVELNSVVQESITALQILVEQRNAAVTVETLPTVSGSRQLLVQLISNLIKNAIVHNDAERPEVTITAQLKERAQRPSRWLISVSDNGPGIEPEAQAQIFELFNRQSKSKADGSGIGLALCRRVARQHGGEIGVRSQPGDGSEFFFDLPLND